MTTKEAPAAPKSLREAIGIIDGWTNCHFMQGCPHDEEIEPVVEFLKALESLPSKSAEKALAEVDVFEILLNEIEAMLANRTLSPIKLRNGITGAITEARDRIDTILSEASPKESAT